MKIIGITAEYNPFHWGHHIQLELARQFADGIVVVQSGPFCQRGDLSVLDPWSKANVAIQAGADLVLALPTQGVLRSAEAFAQTAVEALAGTGIVSHILCGAENPEQRELFIDVAKLRCTEPSDYREALEEGLARGLAWSEASFQAIHAVLDLSKKEDEALRKPNNLLAMAYAKALLELPSKAPELVLHSRVESLSDSQCILLQTARKQYKVKLQLDIPDARFASATVLRAKLGAILQSDDPQLAQLVQDLGPYLPAYARKALYQAYIDHKLIHSTELSSAIFTTFLRATEEELDAFYPDGLGRRIQGACEELVRELETIDNPWEALIAAVATRVHPANQVRRAILQFLIDPDGFKAKPSTSYLQVLAYSRQGRYLLRLMRHKQTLPVFSKASDLQKLGSDVAVQTELKAQRLYRVLSKGHEPDYFSMVPQQLKALEKKAVPAEIVPTEMTTRDDDAGNTPK